YVSHDVRTAHWCPAFGGQSKERWTRAHRKIITDTVGRRSGSRSSKRPRSHAPQPHAHWPDWKANASGSRANRFLIPAVPEAQDRLVRRHHVKEGATRQPAAYGCICAAIVTQSSLLELALQRVVFAQ